MTESIVLYGNTTSLCEECLSLVPTEIIFEDGLVYYSKKCPGHGSQKTLVSTDIAYFLLAKKMAQDPDIKLAITSESSKGCPYDCGLCSDHKQHTCMAIIEVTDECNMHCPTCDASSFPGAGNSRSIEDVSMMLDTIIASEKYPDLVMISGGEPTIHPDILAILDLAESKPIKHILLATNGIRIAQDQEFAAALRKFSKLEVYLQFDSVRAKTLINIRGANLKRIRLGALSNLEKMGVPVTLVCVVKRRINDDEMGSIIKLAQNYRCVRGVTFQPIRLLGRTENFEKITNYITLSEIRNSVLNQLDIFTDMDFIPHPCNPENIAIAYALRTSKGLRPVTSLLLSGGPVDIDAESVTFKNSNIFKKMLYFLPDIDDHTINYNDLFRVTIVSIMDCHNFSTSAAKMSCIHFVTRSSQLIPIDTYYLLHA